MESLIEQVCIETLKNHKLEEGPWEISILLTNDEEIKELNNEYRGKDQPTDVLSFPMLDGDEINELVESPYPVPLGDIVISMETAVRQAHEYNHSLERELGFLVVHSMLHLLGYDHMTKEDEEVMRDMEEDILNNLNLVRE